MYCLLSLLFSGTSTRAEPTWGQIPSTRAGILHLYIGDNWPPWIPVVLHAASLLNDQITFYFLGPRLNVGICDNCVNIRVDPKRLAHRFATHLAVNASLARYIAALPRDKLPHKLCDLKPMWPALFPELTARHKWVGWADNDILFARGLAAEVAALHDDDDLLVPAPWNLPHALSNGQFLLMRAVPRMVHAFRLSDGLVAILSTPEYIVYDEWYGRHPENSFGAVLEGMALQDALRIRTTTLPLLSDTIPTLSPDTWYGRLWARIVGDHSVNRIDDAGARAHVTWRRGVLTGHRKGPCACATDRIPQFSLAQCPECLRPSGWGSNLLQNVPMDTRMEAIGFHFFFWKIDFLTKGLTLPNLSKCPDSFDLRPTGFSCARRD